VQPNIVSDEPLLTCVDVVVPTRSGKAVPVLIEMARGGAEYRALVAALPEAFVGRTEKLRAVTKVMCAAAKQCARENGMHMVLGKLRCWCLGIG
jgi:hypothetical protein